MKDLFWNFNIKTFICGFWVILKFNLKWSIYKLSYNQYYYNNNYT
jgi:hypothetical protein